MLELDLTVQSNLPLLLFHEPDDRAVTKADTPDPLANETPEASQALQAPI